MRNLIKVDNNLTMSSREIADLIAAAPELLDAAIAVIERWDSPLWKDLPATAEYIGRLRKAVNKAQGSLA